MTLLTQYHRNEDGTWDLRLVEPQTSRVEHIITHTEGDAANNSLIMLAEQWAEQNGHFIIYRL